MDGDRGGGGATACGGVSCAGAYEGAVLAEELQEQEGLVHQAPVLLGLCQALIDDALHGCCRSEHDAMQIAVRVMDVWQRRSQAEAESLP